MQTVFNNVSGSEFSPNFWFLPRTVLNHLPFQVWVIILAVIATTDLAEVKQLTGKPIISTLLVLIVIVIV